MDSLTQATLWATVFIPSIDQSSTFISLYDKDDRLSFIELGLEQGKSSISTRNGEDWLTCYSHWKCQGTLNQSIANLQSYQIGWNMICFVVNGNNWQYISYPNFQRTAIHENVNKPYNHSSNYMMIGGSITSTGDVNKELEGIIHSVRIRPSILSEGNIKRFWLRPENPTGVYCDYFISMFEDLGTTDDSNKFIDILYGYNENNQTFRPRSGATFDETNGFKLGNGKNYAPIDNVSILNIFDNIRNFS